MICNDESISSSVPCVTQASLERNLHLLYNQHTGMVNLMYDFQGQFIHLIIYGQQIHFEDQNGLLNLFCPTLVHKHR